MLGATTESAGHVATSDAQQVGINLPVLVMQTVVSVAAIGAAIRLASALFALCEQRLVPLSALPKFFQPIVNVGVKILDDLL